MSVADREERAVEVQDVLAVVQAAQGDRHDLVVGHQLHQPGGAGERGALPDPDEDLAAVDDHVAALDHEVLGPEQHLHVFGEPFEEVGVAAPFVAPAASRPSWSR